MSLYDGIEVETAPMPEISPLDQEDSSTQENISEKSTDRTYSREYILMLRL